jgi:hypothetical protein
MGFFRWIMDTVWRKWLEMTAGMRLLPYNCEPDLTALLIQAFLAKHSVSVLPQPSYLSDLSCLDFFCFLKVKMTLQERRISDARGHHVNTADELRFLQCTSFDQCFQKLKRWWEHCINTQGNYFEGGRHSEAVNLEMKSLLMHSGNFLNKSSMFSIPHWLSYCIWYTECFGNWICMCVFSVLFGPAQEVFPLTLIMEAHTRHGGLCICTPDMTVLVIHCVWNTIFVCPKWMMV